MITDQWTRRWTGRPNCYWLSTGATSGTVPETRGKHFYSVNRGIDITQRTTWKIFGPTIEHGDFPADIECEKGGRRLSERFYSYWAILHWLKLDLPLPPPKPLPKLERNRNHPAPPHWPSRFFFLSFPWYKSQCACEGGFNSSVERCDRRSHKTCPLQFFKLLATKFVLKR